MKEENAFNFDGLIENDGKRMLQSQNQLKDAKVKRTT